MSANGPGTSIPEAHRVGTQTVVVTLFDSLGAKRKSEHALLWQELASLIRDARGPSKQDLGLLKLARFGEKRSTKGSLRHDANLLCITGIEADYDGEKIPFAEASERLLKAGIRSLIYTSPSHTEDAPRWRVLCPTSSELDPGQRTELLGRLNGVLGGVVSTESWTLSQSYYFGSVRSNPSHQVELVDGWHIDTLDELDSIWAGKGGTSNTSAASPRRTAAQAPIDEPALLEEIRNGKSYHMASVRLLGRWALEGVPMLESRRRLVQGMNAVPETGRDDRWKARFNDIDRCLEDIYIKEAVASGPSHS